MFICYVHTSLKLSIKQQKHEHFKQNQNTSTKVVQNPENAATLSSEIKVIKYIFIYNPHVKWSTVHVLKHTQ